MEYFRKSVTFTEFGDPPSSHTQILFGVELNAHLWPIHHL